MHRRRPTECRDTQPTLLRVRIQGGRPEGGPISEHPTTPSPTRKSLLPPFSANPQRLPVFVGSPPLRIGCKRDHTVGRLRGLVSVFQVRLC